MGKVIRNVLRGFGSIGGVYPQESNLPKIHSRALSTEDAMREDWNRVGTDISRAIEKYEQQSQKAQ